MHQWNTSKLNAHFLELEGVLDRIERAFNHYQVLGVERSATTERIGQAYGETIRLLRPTDGRHDALPSTTLERIKQGSEKVHEAYSVLSSFGRRVEYDNLLVRRATIPLPVNLPGLPENGKRPGPKPPVETKPVPLPVLAGLSENGKLPDPQPTVETKPAPEPEPVQACEVVAIKNYSAGQAVFTKVLEEGGNRRRYQRFKLSIPTYVIGYERTGEKWKEMTETVDVSIGGVAVQTAKEVHEGSVVHLTMPFPVKLRRHGHSEPTYQVYAVVRRVDWSDEGQRVLGLEFVGSSPPPGYLKRPWARFTVRY
jgi:hypothetical protein